MRNLRPRPPRQIEEFFIPTERKSSLRSQTYPSAKTATKTPSSVFCIGSNATKYLKEPPSRKRDKVVDIDSDETKPEMKPSPTKRSKANKARLSYPSPPSDEDTIMIEAMSGTVLVDLPLEVSTDALGLPIHPTPVAPQKTCSCHDEHVCLCPLNLLPCILIHHGY